MDRIYNELLAAGLDNQKKLSVADLVPFDQYHYHGTHAGNVAIASLGIDSKDRVLEIGSGIGGPSRYIAANTGARVIALELQPDLNQTAEDLTRRCGLSNRVEHVCTDVLDYSPADSQFDVIVSWLAFFHIEQREQLLARCINWLKPSGSVFVEDLYARGEFTLVEQEDLAAKVFSHYLPTREVYEADFRAAGFSRLQIDDMSEDWQQYTHERYAAFCRDRERNEKVHGKVIVDKLESFYGSVDRLFSGDNLGGLRVIARKGQQSAKTLSEPWYRQ